MNCAVIALLKHLELSCSALILCPMYVIVGVFIDHY